MTLDPDPYRTLGLARGATLDEVKRAYRRLAKINHPDAAGEAALPRFLAIQAAYEQLIGGGPGRPTGRRPAPAPRRGWDADRDRGSELAGLGEEITDAARPNADDHLDELGRTD